MTLTAERQSARMSKITNDGLTRSGTECFIAVGIKGFTRGHEVKCETVVVGGKECQRTG